MVTITNYDFEGPYETTTSLRDDAGIYAILDYRPNSGRYLLDVGESTTVKTRIDNHERWFCWERNRQGNIWFAVLYTPTWSADQRRSLESAIRQQYWIPCGER